MSRSLKWVVRAVGGVFFIALLIVGAVALTLNTQAGTRWAIKNIDSRIPGELSIESFGGTLWAGLEISVARYRNNSADIYVTDAELRVDWSAVPAGRLVMSVLTASSVRYQNLAADEDPALASQTPGPFEMDFSPLPIPLGITRGRVGSLTLTSGNPLVIRDIVLDDVMLDGISLRAGLASAATGELDFSATGVAAELGGDIPLRANLRWSSGDDSWAGRGAVRGNLAALEFDHAVTGPYPASATGEVRLLHRIQPEIEAVVNWERWLFGEYVLEDGELSVLGTSGDYSSEFDALLRMPRVDSIRVAGTAAGNLERLTAFSVHAESGVGIADLAGSLAWQPEFTAAARIRTSGFDPSLLREELTGSLDAEFNFRLGSDGDVDISDAVVSGVLNDASISANGTVSIADDQVRCSNCVVNVGENRINVDGYYGRGDDILTFEIAAPALAELWPEFSGSLDGEGELTGAATNPRFTGQVHGERLEFEHWAAAEVVVISRASSLESFDLSAAVTSFSVDETDLGSFTVTGKGGPELLDMILAWDFRGLNIRAEGNVRQSVDRIDGTIASASVTEANTGRWSLEDHLQFGISGGDISVSPHAWTGELGKLQVSRFSSEQDEIELAAGIQSLPLQFANAFIPENLQLSGTANAGIDISRRGGQWSGSIEWEQDKTILRVLEANEELTEVSIPKSELNIALRDGGAHASAAMTIEPGVSAVLEVTFADLSKDSPIDAELRLEGQNWYWVPAVFPVLDNFEGAISATVNASGPLLSPVFSGSLNWKDGGLVVPSLNVPVTDIDLTVTGSSAGAATVSGTAKAGDGDLSIDGAVENVMLPTRFVNMRVRGSTAEIVNWPEYHLWASPDLVVVGTREGWVFSGSFEVPRAEVAITDLSDDAVMPSPDVVVVGQEQLTVEEPTRIDGVAKLTLGENVHVTAFGLDTKLRGDLQVRMFKDRPTSAEGRVSLVEGIFSAYGQKLTIQEGTLTFTGPLDNPIVDVRAVRVIESFDGQVTAGIHLQGRAQQINSTVYSDPPMSEADALSYLVVGRPLSQATQSEGGELSSAALALGVRQAGRVTDQIGQALGLDQLTVAGDGGDTTALVAGKQINSRLHARYAYGVFSRLGTLLLRYRLSKRLTLEAGAGEAQSIDLLYLVEKE